MSCTLCPLHEGAKSVCVPPVGPLEASILVIGDAPGAYEDATNKGFVGKGGALLWAALDEVGLTNKVCATTAVRCRPENNRKPTAPEYKACATHTETLVRSMPNLSIIVVMGETAMRSVGIQGSMAVRAGTPNAKHLWDKDLTIVPIARAEDVLNARIDGSVWEEHWRVIKGLLDPPDVEMVTSMIGWRTGTIPGEGPLALDIETTGLDPRHISFLCYSLSDGETTVSYDIKEGGDLRRLRDVFAGERELVFHNAAYEGLMSEELLGVRPKNVVDTALLARRDNPWQSVSLAALTAKNLPEIAGFKTETDVLTARGVAWWELPRDILLRRNALDTWATAQLYQQHKARLSSEQWEYVREDAQLAMMMARIGNKGLHVDEDALLRIKEESEAVKQRTSKATGINPNSGPQLGEYLEGLGLTLRRNPKTGNIVADEEALLALSCDTEEQSQALQDVLDYRGAVKMQGTYVAGYAKHVVGNLLRSKRLQWPGTVSWRGASSKPNIQNIPQGDFRTVFSGPDGQWLWESDYGQAQFRAGAVLSRDPNMLAACKSGDPHGLLATRYFGEGYTKDQRFHAKTSNFLLIFEGSVNVLISTFRKAGVYLDRATAEKYHAEFWSAYQGLGMYWKRQEQMMQRHEPIIGACGGYVWKIDDAVAASNGNWHTAMATIKNALFQSPEARLTLKAALRAEAEGIDVRLQTHDGLVGYGKKEEVLDIAARVSYHMEEVAKEEEWLRDIPFPADPKTGPNWGEMK